MKNIGYVLRRMLRMNFTAMFKKINSIHKKTGKSRLFLLRDLRRCALRHGAGYMDYDLFEMYNLTDAQRGTYLTRGRNNALIKQYNDLTFAHYFDNKAEFYERFDPYIRRQWIRMDAPKEQVLAFIAGHETFIAKPAEGSCGHGIEKITVADSESPEKIYERLNQIDALMLLEDVIIQHPEVSRIYPESINTVRAVTINKEGTVHVICTYFRIGNNGRHVDNFNSGGMVTPVDERTGVVKDRAIDKNKVLYAVHPYTDQPIQGFQFPDWEQAMDLVRAAAQEIPEMGYLGWDVAFTPDGPCLVEGNNFPGHDIYQLPEHTPDKLGMMPKFNV